MRDMRSSIIEIAKNADCSVCSKEQEEIVLMDEGQRCTAGEISVLDYELVVADEGYVLVDVREVEEYEAGFIPGAVNVPLSMIVEGDGVADIKALKERPVFTCRSGQRSRQGAAFLQAMGVEVACLSIDYLDWEERADA